MTLMWLSDIHKHRGVDEAKPPPKSPLRLFGLFPTVIVKEQSPHDLGFFEKQEPPSPNNFNGLSLMYTSGKYLHRKPSQLSK